MIADDSELGEMLVRRSRRGRPEEVLELVSTATAAQRPRFRFGSGTGAFRRVAAVGVTAGLALILIGLAVGGSRFEPTPTPREVPSSPPASSPSATVAHSPSVVVPPEPSGTPIDVRVVQSPAVRWGGANRYAACVRDARERTVIALTDVGAVDRWSAHVVLPVPGGNALFRCDVAVAGDALVVLTLADPDSHERAWLVSETGARELPWYTSSGGLSRIRGVGDRVVAVVGGRSVVEIDRSGTTMTWDLPDAEPRAGEIEDAAIDSLGRRWLLGRPREGTMLTTLWRKESSAWRAIQFLSPAISRDLWLDGKPNPGVARPVWSETRGWSIARAATADAQGGSVDLPTGSLPIGVLKSGRLVTQQMTWLRIEQDPARVCKQGDAPCFRWATLLVGLDQPLGPDERRYVAVAGEDVVVTDRHGVRATPSSNASPELSDEADASPLPKLAPNENPLSLTFRDSTGLVTARAAFTPPYDAALPGRMAVVNKAGLGRVLWVTWTTWACERKPTLKFSRRGDEYEITVNTGPHPPGGCDTVNGSFAVEIRLAQSIDADFVKTIFENPPP